MHMPLTVSLSLPLPLLLPLILLLPRLCWFLPYTPVLGPAPVSTTTTTQPLILSLQQLLPLPSPCSCPCTCSYPYPCIWTCPCTCSYPYPCIWTCPAPAPASAYLHISHLGTRSISVGRRPYRIPSLPTAPAPIWGSGCERFYYQWQFLLRFFLLRMFSVSFIIDHSVHLFW